LIFAVRVWPFPAPNGVILDGALGGGRIALIALGIALIYRANRVINFAQGDLGQVPATLGALLVITLSVNYFVAFTTGLVAAVVLGIVVETLIIRRFFRAPPADPHRRHDRALPGPDRRGPVPGSGVRTGLPDQPARPAVHG
jgi:branched-chain amino acid transport system permease protein